MRGCGYMDGCTWVGMGVGVGVFAGVKNGWLVGCIGV